MSEQHNVFVIADEFRKLREENEVLRDVLRQSTTKEIKDVFAAIPANKDIQAWNAGWEAGYLAGQKAAQRRLT